MACKGKKKKEQVSEEVNHVPRRNDYDRDR